MEKKYFFIAYRNHFWFGINPESAFSQVAECPAVVVSCKIEGGSHLLMIPFKIGENLLSQRWDIMFSFHPVVNQIPQNVQSDSFRTAPADQCTQIFLKIGRASCRERVEFAEVGARRGEKQLTHI